MARPIAILRALGTAFRRDWTGFQTLAGNNFFLITLFLLRNAGGFVYLIMGLVLLFPLSTDPLRKVPPSRMALWPLERGDRWILRLASPWINPLTWGLAALAVWGAGRNVAWKVKVPGYGWSSPVVWGDRVFVTTAVADNQTAPPRRGPGGGPPAPPDVEYLPSLAQQTYRPGQGWVDATSRIDLPARAHQIGDAIAQSRCQSFVRSKY